MGSLQDLAGLIAASGTRTGQSAFDRVGRDFTWTLRSIGAAGRPDDSSDDGPTSLEVNRENARISLETTRALGR
jgi:hypothetical protein